MSSMNKTYKYLAKQDLNACPVVNGQVLILDDADGMYYDVGSTRHQVSGVKVVAALPASGQSDILYIELSNQHASAHVWNGSAYIEIAGAPEYAEMTIAQYNALTSDQKMDGTLRFITDTPDSLAV